MSEGLQKPEYGEIPLKDAVENHTAMNDSNMKNKADKIGKFSPLNDSIKLAHEDINNPNHELTYIQQHYLKKVLLTMEITREFNALSPTYNDITGLRRFGPPFKKYGPKDDTITSIQVNKNPDEEYDSYARQFPVLRFVMDNFVTTFPFIRMHLEKLGPNSDDQSQFWDKIQELFESWKSKKISNSNDRGELSRRQLTLYKVNALLVMIFNSAVRCTADDEYFNTNIEERNAYKSIYKIVGKDAQETTDNTNNKDTASIQSSVSTLSDLESLYSLDEDYNYINGLAINVIGVSRVQIPSKSPKSKGFYEFIIQIRDEASGNNWFVKRRYSEFRKLHRKISLLHSECKIPSLPSKDKTELRFQDSTGEENSTLSELNSITSSITPETSNLQNVEPNISSLEQSFLNAFNLGIKRNSSDSSVSTATSIRKFPRESMRHALRSYLKSVVSVSALKESKEFQEFISMHRCEPNTTELKDIAARKNLDYLLDKQHLNFQKEMIEAVKNIEKSMSELKGKIMDVGIGFIFTELKMKESIGNLSTPFKALVQLIELEVASTEYEWLIGSDSALSTFKSIKRLHRLFPYKLMAGIMRFTNPLQIAKKLIDLFTYQVPHIFHKGRRQSLLQVLFTGLLEDDVKKADHDIKVITNEFRKKVDFKPNADGYYLILDKIDEYFKYTDDAVLQIKKEAEYFKMDLLLSILLHQKDGETQIPDDVLMDLIQDNKKKSEERSIYAICMAYFRLKLRKEDQMSLITLWQESEMINVMKEILAIIFEPLIALFRRAELYKYIPIFAKYIDDLIALVEYYNKDYGKLKQADMVTSFMAIEDKYSEYGYKFLHNLYMNDLKADPKDRVFDGLADWFDRFVRLLQYSKECKSSDEIDITKLLEVTCKTEEERARVIKRIDQIIMDIEAKRNYYEKIQNSDSTDNNDQSINEQGDRTDNDYMKRMRNGKLNKNWDKINQKVLNLTTNMTQSGENNSNGILGLVGLDHDDVMDMNIDLMDIPPKESKRKTIADFNSASEFLQFYLHSTSEGLLESDVEFKKLQEWEDTKYQDDLGCLAKSFTGKVFEYLKKFKEVNNEK